MSEYTLFDDLKARELTYDEALKIARLSKAVSAATHIPYQDPIKGTGQLSVTSMGIIDRSRPEVK